VNLYAAWGFEHRGTIHWAGKTYDSAVMVRHQAPRSVTAGK